MHVVDLLPSLRKVRQITGETWQACCPAHQDDNPSLSIRLAGDKILLYCWAGCNIGQIVAALGLTTRDLSLGGSSNGPLNVRRDPLAESALASIHDWHQGEVTRIGCELRRRDENIQVLHDFVKTGTLSLETALERMAQYHLGYAELEEEFWAHLAKLR